MEDQNIQREIESDVILSFMTSSLEQKLIFQKQDLLTNSVSDLYSDFKENKKKVLKSENFFQNFSDSEVSSGLLSEKFGFLGKIVSSDSNLKSKILDESFTLNDDYYKPKRKRRRSKKQAKVISDSSNSCDSNISDRTLSTPSRQIWRVKRTSDESTTDEDRYVDKIYKSDSFAVCNKISKYSINQMIRISKDVSYSSSDSSSDDYAFSSADFYFRGMLVIWSLRSIDLGVIEPKSFYRTRSRSVDVAFLIWENMKLSHLQCMHDQVDPDHQGHEGKKLRRS
ncbi:hypothetical protein L6452_27879 [Arctium lappa]|uniref:Uncharacterized protein n=1 Tax=Arctium lappa TaxID=4217 RepID=A0ACB8ZY91_ARCLA|nr:hypothetical protein L6452_27879 [Arctium lappa]